MILNKKVVLITGASDGIGKAIAIRLAAENCSLILLGRNQIRLNQVREDSLKLGAKEVKIYAFDLSDRNSATDNLENIRNNHKNISVLINNAGVWQKLGQLDQLNHDQIEEVINTNLTGLIKITNTLLPVLRAQVEGAIVNISSRSGYSAQAGQSVYTASKYGVRGFTEVLYQDLKDTRVRVTGIYQGGTNTRMFAKAGEDWPDETYDRFIPPAEIAEVIAFMLTRSNQIWIPEVRIESK